MVRQYGFLLTHQVREVNGQSSLEFWVTTDNGPTRLVIPQQTHCYFASEEYAQKIEELARTAQLVIEIKKVNLNTFEQIPVVAIYTQTLTSANQLASLCHEHDIILYEDDIRLAERYLMERFIKGGLEFVGQPREHRFSHLEFHDVRCRAADYTPHLKLVSLDLECSEKGILYSIGLHGDSDSRVIMIGDARDATSEILIEWVANEKDLLLAMFRWFETFDPDIIIGWNVIDFDFQLLYKRASWHNLPFNIGRGGLKGYFRTSANQKSYISIPGRAVIDGIDALKTATYYFRSWSLESVSQELLGEGKKIHNVHDRMAEINHMFRHDKASLAKYNLQDCKLVTKIFAKTHLMDFLVQRSKLTGLEIDRVGGSVAAFTNLYLPQLHRAGYIAPNLLSENWIASPGGYVMDSIPGLYDSVLVLDFKSLYPSIIRTFLIDPLGLIEGLRQEIGNDINQAVPGFRGGQFHRTQHFLPQMIDELWQARDVAKKNNEKAFSQAIKIIMNSFYGVLGSSGCRFFDTRLASSITMRGHEIMKKTRELIEAKGYTVIYGDTDSTFVSLGSKTDISRANQIGQQLVEEINLWWKTLLLEDYALESCLEIEYETHYQRFLMPTIRGAEVGSKKRYAGLKIEDDGTKNLIFKGLESVRTDWTELSQKFQYQLYSTIFENNDPEQYVKDIVEATLAGEHDNELVYRKRLRRHLADYQKNIPPQVRAARIADDINKQMGRPLQYQNKGTIEYVITIAGPEPVEYRKHAIDYDHYINKQLKPVADAILPFIGKTFNDILKPQLGLF
ncbi:DNA polymerase II [Vibrio viridaestus]|uniref:DNA polymerase n=1 Tax=Vibrio viridaestus TaxID=2487322 RepID=A0A3N9TGL2_9VIBR|nr:DNA polymerase II [Vibrio viridaestus]RQW63411.1 DNA polymerase II [Vibrio viridaestus]